MTVTIKDLRARADSSPITKLQFQLLMWKVDKPAYAEWVGLVESAISVQVTEVSKHRNHLQDSGEDAITSTLVIGLECLGLTASSAMVNGNCDVVVRFDDYLWLGEAKIFTGASVVWGGYLQLTQRYATGLPTQNSGGMLLYCFKDSADVLLTEWRAVLEVQVEGSDPKDGDHPLTFRSKDASSSSGLTLDILHFAFPLLHQPQEDEVKLTAKALEAGRAAKKAAKKEGSAHP